MGSPAEDHGFALREEQCQRRRSTIVGPSVSMLLEAPEAIQAASRSFTRASRSARVAANVSVSKPALRRLLPSRYSSTAPSSWIRLDWLARPSKSGFPSVLPRVLPPEIDEGQIKRQ